MLVIPAVDVFTGLCVQAAAISDPETRAQLEEPLRAVQHWAACGFSRLQLLDLDADDRHSDGSSIVASALRESTMSIQVGVREWTIDRVDQAFTRGARFVVTSVHDTGELEQLETTADVWPDLVLADVTVQGDRVLNRARRAGRRLTAILEELTAMPLAGVVVTAATRRGLMSGADVRLMTEAARACSLPLYAAGGISSRRDLDELAECGVAGAVVGTALYTGAVDPRLIADEYSGIPGTL
jgi:phosphoribosylformimino-5-aminoimidazole carboxamide ribotide isomerase